MAELLVSGNIIALVDDEDLERLSAHRWFIHSGGYASRQEGTWRKGRKQIYMHQEVMGGKIIDHINANKLDNRKANLRFATKGQNNANRGLLSNNTSGYKGVTWDKSRGKYQAYAWFQDKKYYLGRFDSILDAAKVVDDFNKKYFGEFAYLNIKEK